MSKTADDERDAANSETTETGEDIAHIRERVAGYLDRNPDADSAPAVLGGLLLNPDHRPLVEEMLAERGREASDSDESADVEGGESA